MVIYCNNPNASIQPKKFLLAWTQIFCLLEKKKNDFIIAESLEGPLRDI